MMTRYLTIFALLFGTLSAQGVWSGMGSVCLGCSESVCSDASVSACGTSALDDGSHHHDAIDGTDGSDGSDGSDAADTSCQTSSALCTCSAAPTDMPTPESKQSMMVYQTGPMVARTDRPRPMGLDVELGESHEALSVGLDPVPMTNGLRRALLSLWLT